MHEIETGMFERDCGYCPHRIDSITIPDEKSAKLTNESIPPTHIEIECPKCENIFYYTQDNWDSLFDSRSLHTEIKTRKTSPGKNIYVPKEDVINVQ